MEGNLQTKAAYLKLFEQINKPLLQYRNASKTRMVYGHNGVGYGTKIAGIEGFARYLWGAGPAIGQLPDEEVANIIEGIVNGTDPAHPDYWGELGDYDQRMVEMPAIALTLLHADQLVWHKLSAGNKEQVSLWLYQIFEHVCADGNWQFFKIIVALVLKKLGCNYDQKDLENAKRLIARCYLKDGWYQDSSRGRQDYYTPFAFQYYGLMYSTLEPEDELSHIFKARAQEFVHQYIHFFAANGANIPFGRSMTYRYAVSAFWVAAVYAGVDGLDLGVAKGIINRNIRWWLRQPIFDAQGLLTLGYTYPQLLMTEPYNSPQSPYWSNKIFLLLELPEEHAYWQTAEKEYPKAPAVKVLEAAHFLAVHHHGHSELLNAGQPAPNYHVLANEKYLKFAYSSQFGFSIPRGNQLKEEAVMDSMLGIQAADTKILVSVKRQDTEVVGQYFVRNRVKDVVIGEDVIASTWQLNEHAVIRTWLTSLDGWQIRIHRLVFDQSYSIYETGYAIENNPDCAGKISDDADENYVSGKKGFSGIVNLLSETPRKTALTTCFPNTNLMTPELVTLPGFEHICSQGTHYLATAVFANQDAAYSEAAWQDKPELVLDKQQVLVKHAGHVLSFSLAKGALK